MLQFNYKDEIVSSPAVIVSGRTSTHDRGVVEFENNNSEVFPTLWFEVNNYHFKALVHVSPNTANTFKVRFWAGAAIDGQGNIVGKQGVADTGHVTLFYNPLPQNKPVHLCVVVGSDSTGAYDMPRYKSDRGEAANLDTAIQRLKVAARMMQAFTQDEFHRLGLSNRCFPFVEELTRSMLVFGSTESAQNPHMEVKVHVLRLPKTKAQLRDLDYAQQNPAAKDNGFLFSHAIDLVSQSDLMAPYASSGTAIQCAVMYLDSHWDGKVIRAHAALGGGTDQVKMAIFGSHGLHAYPLTFGQMTPCFLDETRLSLSEVANDVNQCLTPWECLNICMGAFMHEIGHSLGSPHQVDGVMLRDYMWWNRQFMTREVACVRDGSRGSVVGASGDFPKHCHWNIMDINRYFYHGSFSIPNDASDPSFPKVTLTVMQPLAQAQAPVPSMYVTGPGQVVVKSSLGIYMVEFVTEDLARYHLSFYPKCYGGPGPQPEISLDFDECLREVRRRWRDSANDFHLRVLSMSGDLWVENFKTKCFPSKDSVVKSDFNLGKGQVAGTKSELLGSAKGDMRFIGFDPARVYQVRVYHGGALDGIHFFFHAAERPPVPTPAEQKLPKRHLLSKILLKSSHDDVPTGNSGAGDVLIGNQTGNYTDFYVPSGEKISRLSFRNGAWIDAVQIETDRGTSSPMLGNASGGHLSVLEPPTRRHSIVGLYGYTNRWMDGVGIIYAQA